MNEQLKVAILGPLGTYTHEVRCIAVNLRDNLRNYLRLQAALKVFGSHGVYDEHLSIAGAILSTALMI